MPGDSSLPGSGPPLDKTVRVAVDMAGRSISGLVVPFEKSSRHGIGAGTTRVELAAETWWRGPRSRPPSRRTRTRGIEMHTHDGHLDLDPIHAAIPFKG